MDTLLEFGGGFLEIPRFFVYLLFKSGVFSIVFWMGIVVCLVLRRYEIIGERAEEKHTIILKQKSSKFKAYGNS